MSLGVSEASLADIAAVTNGNDGFGGGNGLWWLIILVLLFNGGYGYGFGGGNMGGTSVKDQYTLTSDFAQLSNQVSDGFTAVDRRTDMIVEGINGLAYTTAQLVNGTNTNLMQGQFAIEKAIADGYTQAQLATANLGYNISNQTAVLASEIDKGFCNTNYNLATQNTQTLAAIDRAADRILDRMTTDKMDALRDENATLRLAASQSVQTNEIVSRLNPTPVPSYNVPNPNCCYTGCGCGCGCNG